MIQETLHVTRKDVDAHGRYLGPRKFDAPFRGSLHVDSGLGTILFVKNVWVTGNLVIGEASELRAGGSIRAGHIDAAGTIAASDYIICGGEVRGLHLIAGSYITAAKSVLLNGSLKAGGFLHVCRDVEVRGELRVLDNLWAGRCIKAGLGVIARTIRAGRHIVGGGIEAGGSIRSGGHIWARTDIRSERGLEARGNITAGMGIIAGESISCARLWAGSRIFAGVSPRPHNDLTRQPVVRIRALGHGIIAYGTVVLVARRSRRRPSENSIILPHENAGAEMAFAT